MLTTRFHLDEAHLKYYDEKFKSWASSQPVKTLPSSLYPWTLTEKAGAVTCWPVGGTELKPSVDFMFTETGPASGDKGPENPSTITGVSSVKVTRCGKNLLTRNSIYETMSSRGITVSYNADGSIHLKGTASSNYFPYLWYFTAVPGVVPKVLSTGTTITISLSCSDNNVFCTLNDSPSAAAWQSGVNIYPGTPLTHTMSSDVKTAHFGIYVAKSATVDCDVYCQIEFGQSATAWEAPADEDYTLPLGNTYYGGNIDLASGVMTVTWWGHVFDGTEAISAFTVLGANSRVSYYNGIRALNQSQQACSHLPLLHNYTSDTPHFYVSTTEAGGMSFFVPQTTQATYKQWLADQITAGFPFTVICRLHSPVISQLTQTQIFSLAQADKYTPRLNTIYTDASAVQVGYVKSPIREEYELQQAIVAQGGNV